MKNKGLYLLAVAALFLFAFKKKSRGSVEIGPLQSAQLVAAGGAVLYKSPSELNILYTFKGGEWLTTIKEFPDLFLVEYNSPMGLKRGYIAREDVKNFR
jgi:hypothetical protein